MRRPLRELILGLTLVALPRVAALAADAQAGERRVFIACPIVQDTASVPCWLSSDGHETYYLGIQVDISNSFHPPQFRHRVLVEGTVSDEPRICGGIVLKPLTLSVLPEVDNSCQTLRPDAGYTLIDPPRGPGPSNRGKRIASDPAPASVPPSPTDPQPFVPKTYVVPFAFDGLYMDLQSFMNVLMAARYANTGHPNHVRITGYRCRVRLSNGKIVVEKEDLAQQRALKVDQALKELAVGSAIDTHWDTAPQDAGAATVARRVDITVTPD